MPEYSALSALNMIILEYSSDSVTYSNWYIPANLDPSFEHRAHYHEILDLQVRVLPLPPYKSTLVSRSPINIKLRLKCSYMVVLCNSRGREALAGCRVGFEYLPEYAIFK